MISLKFPIFCAIQQIANRNVHLASLYDSFAKRIWIDFSNVWNAQMQLTETQNFLLGDEIKRQNDEIKDRIANQYRIYGTSQPISRPVSDPSDPDDKISLLEDESEELTGNAELLDNVPLHIIHRILSDEMLRVIENRIKLKTLIAAIPFPPFNVVNLVTTYIPTYFELVVRSLGEIIQFPVEWVLFRFKYPLSGLERVSYGALLLVFGLPLLALWGIGNFVEMAADNIAHLRLTLVAATNGAVGPLAKNFLFTAIIFTGMIATVMFCIPVFGQMAAGGVLALIAFAKALSFILAGGIVIKGITWAVNKIINTIRHRCGLKGDSRSDNGNLPPVLQELVDDARKEQRAARRHAPNVLLKSEVGLGSNLPSSAPAKSAAATEAEIQRKNTLRDHIVRRDRPSHDMYPKYENAAEQYGYTRQRRYVGGENENYLVYLQNFNAPYNIFSTPMRVADVTRLLGNDITVYRKNNNHIAESSEETQLPKELLRLAGLPLPDSAAAKQELTHPPAQPRSNVAISSLFPDEIKQKLSPHVVDVDALLKNIDEKNYSEKALKQGYKDPIRVSDVCNTGSDSTVYIQNIHDGEVFSTPMRAADVETYLGPSTIVYRHEGSEPFITTATLPPAALCALASLSLPAKADSQAHASKAPAKDEKSSTLSQLPQPVPKGTLNLPGSTDIPCLPGKFFTGFHVKPIITKEAKYLRDEQPIYVCTRTDASGATIKRYAVLYGNLLDPRYTSGQREPVLLSELRRDSGKWSLTNNTTIQVLPGKNFSDDVNAKAIGLTWQRDFPDTQPVHFRYEHYLNGTSSFKPEFVVCLETLEDNQRFYVYTGDNNASGTGSIERTPITVVEYKQRLAKQVSAASESKSDLVARPHHTVANPPAEQLVAFMSKGTGPLAAAPAAAPTPGNTAPVPTAVPIATPSVA